MTELFYVAVKASLHASDSSVFGLTTEEVIALSKRYPDSNREVINGVLIKASPLKVINSLCELGYRVVCSSGETEIVWTLRREVLDKHGLNQNAKKVEVEKPKFIERYGFLDKTTEVEIKKNNSLTKRDDLPMTVERPETKEKKEKEQKLGTKPEDYAEFYDYKGSRIFVRNPSSLENIDEAAKIIVNTNATSPENPIGIGTFPPTNIPYQEKINSDMDHHHSAPPPIPSVHQTLDEMDFERGIWTQALMGDVGKVRKHLKKGVYVDIEDNSGYTALHYAARNGHGHVCSLLLEAGALIDKPTRAGCSTALHRAAMAGHADTCDLLLRFGANPLCRDIDGRTPLHRAVEHGQKDVISLFLEMMPAAAFEKDNKGRSPLDYAANNKNISSMFLNIAETTL